MDNMVRKISAQPSVSSKRKAVPRNISNGDYCLGVDINDDQETCLGVSNPEKLMLGFYNSN